MQALDHLKREHERLRATLDLLRGAMATIPESEFVLREGCFTLAHCLETHNEREVEVVAFLCHLRG